MNANRNTPRWRVDRSLHSAIRCFVPSRAEEQSGQAIVIVLGLVTMLSLGTLVLVQNVTEHYPIVQRDLNGHESYRAMQAGLNEYLYEANANPDTIMCNATVWTGYPNNWTKSSPTIPSGLCQGLQFGSWNPVPNVAATKGIPSYYLFSAPNVYDCNNASHCTSNVNAWVSLTVVGASGYWPNFTSYDVATATIQPSNSFLLNLWWLNFDQEDPVMINQANPPACNYYWASGSHSLVNSCVPVDFVSNETLTGSIFSNDSIFICGSPVINGALTTADSIVNNGSVTVPDPDNGGCANTPSGVTSQTTTKGVTEPIPTDDAVLSGIAAQGGCLYEGPTEIYMAPYNGTYGMYVYSPDTPPGSDGTVGSNDSIDDSGNANPCLSAVTGTFGTGGASGGWVKYPSNGVVFVEDCQSTDATCSGCPSNGTKFTSGPLNGQVCNPLYNMDAPDDYGTQGPTDGDAIVQGTLQGPLTIAAQNNAVITGSLCYATWVSTWPNCSSAPSTLSTADVLGLVAYNFIEVNHPMTNSGGWTNDSACSWQGLSYLAPMGPAGNLGCDLSNPTIDAAILALNQQFFANNFNQGAGLGNLYVNGTIDEDWRGPVGQENNGSLIHGYYKQYNYDTRLQFLSPPEYLNPGTSSWVLGSISSATGPCPSYVSGGCSAP